jgi:hypothetical protein
MIKQARDFIVMLLALTPVTLHAQRSPVAPSPAPHLSIHNADSKFVSNCDPMNFADV